MITYSRWEPSGGYYDYFEVDQRPGINDDLPIPKLPPATEIGVPSTECGRPIPSGARHVGEGELPMGLMATPASVERIGSSEAFSGMTWLAILGIGAAGVGLGIAIGRWR